MLTLSIQINPKSNAHQIAALLREHADTLDGGTAVAVVNTMATETAEPVKAKKKKVAAPVVEETDETEDETDMGFASDDAPEEVEEPEATLQDVIAACQTVVKKSPKGKEKIAKILAKFKVKSVRDLKSAQYSEVLALIGA